MNSIIVGGGVFGMAAARALRARGHHVQLFDPGPLPHPLAASTDISKVIRMEYGSVEPYMALAEDAMAGWRAWNARWAAAGEDRLFHETGVLMVCRQPMAPGGFEYESLRLLEKRGHAPERMDAETLARRFPAWRTGLHVDGFYHAQGGYAESGRVVAALARWAGEEGVRLHIGQRVAALVEEAGRVVGVRDDTGAVHRADAVVVAAGAWASMLVPELGEAIRPSGHPVFHLKPRDPSRFEDGCFPTFTADVARTGYYGFPLHRTGVVKVANHGAGLRQPADAPRAVTAAHHAALRRFLEAVFPDLADAEVVYTRLCFYADTQDEDFWIAPDPDRPGLTVAGGGSGHGFKFAPVLGPLIADAVEGVSNPTLGLFRWRPGLRLERGREAARHHG